VPDSYSSKTRCAAEGLPLLRETLPEVASEKQQGVVADSSLVLRPFPPPVFDLLWRRKAWEIWSRAVTSGRQGVRRHTGVMPNEDSQSPYLYYQCEGWRPEH